MAPDFLDRFSQGSTLCHRLPARLKIFLTLGTILTAVLLPIAQWPWLGCLACLVFAALSLARIPLTYLVRRLLLILPMAIGVGISIPLSHGFKAGWDAAALLIARTSVTLLAALWLVNTTPFEKLLVAAQQLGLPKLFAAMLAMMYRYLFVLFDELARMQTARRARSFHPEPWFRQWLENSQLLGRLLIRAADRGERVHGAMCARGWQGRVRTLG